MKILKKITRKSAKIIKNPQKNANESTCCLVSQGWREEVVAMEKWRGIE